MPEDITAEPTVNCYINVLTQLRLMSDTMELSLHSQSIHIIFGGIYR